MRKVACGRVKIRFFVVMGMSHTVSFGNENFEFLTHAIETNRMSQRYRNAAE